MDFSSVAATSQNSVLCLVESVNAKPSDTKAWLYSSFQAILCRELAYPWVLVSLGAPGTIPPWVLGDGCTSFWDRVEIQRRVGQRAGS